MSNLETGVQKDESVPQPSIYRENIPYEVAIWFQNKLARTNVPEGIKPYISEGDPVTGAPITPIELAYANKWMNKYANPENSYNGFTSFCNSDKTDIEVKQRIKNGMYTDSDLQAVAAFIEAEEGPLFENKKEIDEFLKLYVQ